MATYSVVFRPDRSTYDIVLRDDVGGWHTILGFKSEAAAQEWITEDRRSSSFNQPDDHNC
jgi:hypothetical protein